LAGKHGLYESFLTNHFFLLTSTKLGGVPRGQQLAWTRSSPWDSQKTRAAANGTHWCHIADVAIPSVLNTGQEHTLFQRTVPVPSSCAGAAYGDRTRGALQAAHSQHSEKAVSSRYLEPCLAQGTGTCSPLVLLAAIAHQTQLQCHAGDEVCFQHCSQAPVES